jgi:hypothetical protein
MTVQQSEESFSIVVCANFQRLTQHIGSGRKFLKYRKTLRWDRVIRGMIIHCTLSVVSSCRDTWTWGKFLKSVYPYGDLETLWQQLWRGLLSTKPLLHYRFPHNLSSFCLSVSLKNVNIIFIVMFFLLCLLAASFAFEVFAHYFYDFSRVSTQIYFYRRLPYWKKTRWVIDLFQT